MAEINVFAQLKNTGEKSGKETAKFTFSPGKKIVSMNYSLSDDVLL